MSRREAIRKRFKRLKTEHPTFGRLELYKKTADALRKEYPEITDRVVRSAIPTLSHEEHMKVMKGARTKEQREKAIRNMKQYRELYEFLLKRPEIREAIREKKIRGVKDLDRLLAESITDKSEKTLLRYRQGRLGDSEKLFKTITRPAYASSGRPPKALTKPKKERVVRIKPSEAMKKEIKGITMKERCALFGSEDGRYFWMRTDGKIKREFLKWLPHVPEFTKNRVKKRLRIK